MLKWIGALVGIGPFRWLAINVVMARSQELPGSGGIAGALLGAAGGAMFVSFGPMMTVPADGSATMTLKGVLLEMISRCADAIGLRMLPLMPPLVWLAAVWTAMRLVWALSRQMNELTLPRDWTETEGLLIAVLAVPIVCR